jgi:cell division protein FtsI/penicillin-binding protein 2
MCEALMRSSNLFFGGLALKLDGAKVMDGSQERIGPVKNLDLQAMADRLLPPSSDKEAGYDLMRGSLPRPAGLLRLDRRPITIEAANPPSKTPDRRVMTATSGYGQNVYAAPLAMASIYASIATKSVVRPRLAPRAPAAPADVNTPILQAGTEEERDRYLGILRTGLHGVVAKPGGSARSYFAPVGPRRGASSDAAGRSALLTMGNQPRLFGKTGTATISNRFNTLWFAGWIEGDPKRGIKTPLAFVCQAIQQPRGQKLTGGGVCGPIIRDILLRLDQTASDQAEPASPTKGPPARTKQKGQPR